nr:MAG TPA: hypothetical protein [Caudoviricetes sp.]
MLPQGAFFISSIPLTPSHLSAGATDVTPSVLYLIHTSAL